MGTATTLATLHLTENTDLVAWSPREPNELAIGTYQLDKSSGVRSGHVYLYTLDGADEEEQRLSLAREWAGPGVFEMAWAGAGLGDQGPLLAVALTDGSVRILDAQLRELARTDESEEDALTCCVCWLEAPRPGSASATLLASYSDGSAERFQLAESGLRPCGRWKAHDLEAWAAAPGVGAEPAIAFTGGDDGAIKAWDSRAGDAPVWINRREHTAGVCCIAPSPHLDHEFATGSYDESVRLWDVRWPGRPSVTASAAVGGGVWRLRWHPRDPARLLAAAMQHGFVIVRRCEMDLVPDELYPHQQTLAYGADWRRPGGDLVATASFYDNLVHVWRPGSC